MSDSAPKSPTSSSGAVSIPARIGRYEVLDKVGSGRMGTVYRATDPFIGRFLAIKTFRLDLAPGPQRDRFLQRFYHEARISGGLAHPNIVTLFDVGELDGLPYLVFEHVEGPTLEVAIARLGRLDPTETIRIVEQAAAALDFAHVHGVVHRDIRPANIILGNDKRVRIADFGIARLEGSQLTQLGEILGTPAYMSPEQIRGHELTAESDLFALAICAYEMLSGHRPFVGKTQAELLDAIVYAPPVEPKELRALGIPSRDFMFVFERALAKEPSHRFADGASFSRALKSCLGMVVHDEEPPLVAKIAAPEFKPKPAPAPPTPPPPPLLAPPTSRLIGVVAPPAPKPAPVPDPVSSADATMLGSAAVDDELPETIRLGRLTIPETAPKEERAPSPTKSMARPLSDTQEEPLSSVLGSAPTSASAILTDPKSNKAAGKPDSPAKSEDKTMVMSEPERAAVAKMMSPAALAAAVKSEDKTMVMPENERAAVAQAMRPPRSASPDDKTMVMPESERATVARAGATPESGQNLADRTVMMTESEKAAAARLKPMDRSQRTGSSASSSKPATPPPPMKTGSVARPANLPQSPGAPLAPMKTGSLARPANLPSSPPGGLAPMRTGGVPRPSNQSSSIPMPGPMALEEPRSSMAPKILLAVVVMAAIVALVIGGVFLKRAGGAGSSSSQEKWNDLPVYPESEVTKSALVYSQEMPKPKMEPGRVASVTLSWIVTPEGRVDDPKIIVSASKEIDDMMFEAVRKWRYEPAEKDGKTVPVRILRKYTFGQRGSEGS